MINRWQKIILSDIYDREKIPFGVLERFAEMTHETYVDDWRWLFEKMGFNFDDVLEHVEEHDEYERRKFIYEYFKEQLPMKQNILEVKKALIEFEVWNNLLYMFDHHHDQMKYREESFLKYMHTSAEEWKYTKLRRLNEVRNSLGERQKLRKLELDLRVANGDQLSRDEEDELNFYNEYDKFQHDHKGKVLSDMIRVSGGSEEIGFRGINFDSDFSQFNNPEFVDEIREMKEQMHQKIVEAEFQAREKIKEVRKEKFLLEKQKNEEVKHLEDIKERELLELEEIREKDIATLQEEAHFELDSAIQHKEHELNDAIDKFEHDKQRFIEEFEIELAMKLEKIEELNGTLENEKAMQEEIERRNEEEIERLQAEWDILQNDQIQDYLRTAKKKELIALAHTLQIPIPTSDVVKELKKKISERSDMLQLRYSEKDVEEIIAKRIQELQESSGGNQEAGGGDSLAGGGDSFGGGGDAFGGGGDAFGGGGDAFGDGTPAAPAGKAKKAKKEKQPKPDPFAAYAEANVLPEDWETFTDKDKKLWAKEYENNLKLVAKEEASKKAKAEKEAQIAKEVEARLTREMELKQQEFEKQLKAKEEEFNQRLDKKEAEIQEKLENMEKIDPLAIQDKTTAAEQKLKEAMSRLSDLHKKEDEIDHLKDEEEK